MSFSTGPLSGSPLLDAFAKTTAQPSPQSTEGLLVRAPESSPAATPGAAPNVENPAAPMPPPLVRAPQPPPLSPANPSNLAPAPTKFQVSHDFMQRLNMLAVGIADREPTTVYGFGRVVAAEAMKSPEAVAADYQRYFEQMEKRFPELQGRTPTTKEILERLDGYQQNFDRAVIGAAANSNATALPSPEALWAFVAIRRGEPVPPCIDNALVAARLPQLQAEVKAQPANARAQAAQLLSQKAAANKKAHLPAAAANIAKPVAQSAAQPTDASKPAQPSNEKAAAAVPAADVQDLALAKTIARAQVHRALQAGASDMSATPQGAASSKSSSAFMAHFGLTDADVDAAAQGDWDSAFAEAQAELEATLPPADATAEAVASKKRHEAEEAHAAGSQAARSSELKAQEARREQQGALDRIDGDKRAKAKDAEARAEVLADERRARGEEATERALGARVLDPRHNPARRPQVGVSLRRR